MEPSCLFCLEPISEKLTLNPIGCPCKILAHKQCFEHWFVQKNQMECPICHTVSVPNGVMLDNIHVVYVNTTRMQELERQDAKRHDACIGFCCCILLVWAISMTIMNSVTGQ